MTIEGSANRILETLPNRISDPLKFWAERSPDHPALAEPSGTWTYRELLNAVEKARIWLEKNGVRPGDRVMILCENCRALVACILAISMLDAWPVPVNARLAAREVDQIREHSGARRVLYTTSVSLHARNHAERHAAKIEEVAALGPIGIGPLNEHAIPEPVEQSGADQVGVLIYTSGTTGLPKGVMLTHRNVLFIAAVSAEIRSLAPQDRIYGVLPISHIVGFSTVLLGALLSGATLHLAQRFDPSAVPATIERDRLSVMLGVPSMYALLVEYTKMKGIFSLKFPSLRIISSSGAPLSPALKSEVESLFGMTLGNGYGITECGPTIATVRLDQPRTDTSVGPPLPGVEIRLIGSNGQPVGEGEVGELWVRGPSVMKGYYHAPEETAEAINAEGWFNTRDLARLEGGSLFIVGRAKEMIVRFGFNVYPAEVEGVLNAHPAVFRSAVIGRSAKGAQGDEEVVAFVQVKADTKVEIAELSAHAAQHLAQYKVPSQFVLLAEMPMTPTGKIMKDELLKLAGVDMGIH